ncbi:hypothetical protein EDD22DRAFT_870143 [Suillus occidentalis]|nr:hypothetical protein EDD22DRAFT_870143 [Suillus occidentalis]
MLQLGLPHPLSPGTIWILGVCRKIYSRARAVSQHHFPNALAGLQQAKRFRFIVFGDISSPAWLWQHHISWQDKYHSPEDLDWLVDYLGDVCSDDHETAGDILVLLSSMSVSCSATKVHVYIEKLIACMGSSMPVRLRHAALRAAHRSREVFASIDVGGDADVALTKFSLAILTAVCPQPVATSSDSDPDRFFYPDRDLCYLELVFALARNSVWHPHLYCQINRAIGMIAVCCESNGPYAFYLTGIFLRLASEEMPVSLLRSITEQQWWDMMGNAWYLMIDNPQVVKLLPILVEGTKKYMHMASKLELEWLLRDVNDHIGRLEKRGLRERRDDVAVAAMKELSGKVAEKLYQEILPV